MTFLRHMWAQLAVLALMVLMLRGGPEPDPLNLMTYGQSASIGVCCTPWTTKVRRWFRNLKDRIAPPAPIPRRGLESTYKHNGTWHEIWRWRSCTCDTRNRRVQCGSDEWGEWASYVMGDGCLEWYARMVSHDVSWPTWNPTPYDPDPNSSWTGIADEVDAYIDNTPVAWSPEDAASFRAETIRDLQRWFDQAGESPVWVLDECECTTDTQRLVCTKDGEVWRDDVLREPCWAWMEQAKKRTRSSPRVRITAPAELGEDYVPPKGGF